VKRAGCPLSKLGEAGAEMFEVGLGVGFGAGGFCHEVLGEEGGAMAMDVFLHPSEEGEEVSFGEGGGDSGVFLSAFEELGGVDIAKGVGGKVAEAAHGPMDVLEAAFAVVCGAEVEEFFEFVVPSIGDIGDLEFAGEEGALEFEAEKNMKVVGGFIGLDSDGGVGGAVYGGEEVIERDLT